MNKKLAGYVPENLKTKDDLTPSEVAVVESRKMTLNDALIIIENACNFLEEQRDLRSPSGRNSAGATGFLVNRTVECFLENKKTIDMLSNLIGVSPTSWKNVDKLKVFCILSESHIEHAFGNIIRLSYAENILFAEYVSLKRKTEITYLLKTCQTPFNFISDEYKNYAAPPKSPLSALEVLNLTTKARSSRMGCVRLIPEKRTAEGLMLVKSEGNTIKGQRSVANRSIHKPRAWYPPRKLVLSRLAMKWKMMVEKTLMMKGRLIMRGKL